MRLTIENSNIINNWFYLNNIQTNIFYGIYQILCLSNNKRYVGSSKNISKRWYNHHRLLSKNMHPSKKLQSDFNIYGIDHFRFNIIEMSNKEILGIREQFWMDHYLSYIDGYNVSTKPYFVRGIEWSEESKINKSKERAYLLNEDDVLEIKKLLSIGTDYKTISDKFNISKSHVEGIKMGRTWKRVKFDESNYKRGQLRGSEAFFAKLLEEDVINIMLLFNFCIVKEIASIYNVSQHCIKDILYRRSWKHLDDYRSRKIATKKLNEEQVSMIKKLIKFLSHSEIAKIYNINKSTVGNIAIEKRWKHVKEYK